MRRVFAGKIFILECWAGRQLYEQHGLAVEWHC